MSTPPNRVEVTTADQLLSQLLETTIRDLQNRLGTGDWTNIFSAEGHEFFQLDIKMNNPRYVGLHFDQPVTELPKSELKDMRWVGWWGLEFHTDGRIEATRMEHFEYEDSHSKAQAVAYIEDGLTTTVDSFEGLPPHIQQAVPLAIALIPALRDADIVESY